MKPVQSYLPSTARLERLATPVQSKEKTMSNPKRLVVTFCLISVLAFTALAGEIQSPPCAPPIPGEIQAPPCSESQLATDDPTNLGESEALSTVETVMITTIADAALGALLSVF
jgi:hypothetical protein